MINTVKLRIIGQELPRNTTMEQIKSILYGGVCINEETVLGSARVTRVFFEYNGELHVRAIGNTLDYIKGLPRNLRDSSKLDDYHLMSVLRMLRDNKITLTVLCKIDGTITEVTTPKGLSALKDFA